MPVNIKLQADVQSDDAQTTDDFRVIGNLLRTQHNAAGKVIHIVVNLAQGIGRDSQAGGAGPADFARFQ